MAPEPDPSSEPAEHLLVIALLERLITNVVTSQAIRAAGVEEAPPVAPDGQCTGTFWGWSRRVTPGMRPAWVSRVPLSYAASGPELQACPGRAQVHGRRLTLDAAPAPMPRLSEPWQPPLRLHKCGARTGE